MFVSSGADSRSCRYVLPSVRAHSVTRLKLSPVVASVRDVGVRVRALGRGQPVPPETSGTLAGTLLVSVREAVLTFVTFLMTPSFGYIKCKLFQYFMLIACYGLLPWSSGLYNFDVYFPLF